MSFHDDIHAYVVYFDHTYTFESLSLAPLGSFAFSSLIVPLQLSAFILCFVLFQVRSVLEQKMGCCRCFQLL